MPILVRGDQLKPETKQAVLQAFVYRWTYDNHRREQAWKGIEGQPTIPLISDDQWLREHAFYVNRDGSLSNRHQHAEPHYFIDELRRLQSKQER